MKPTHEAVVSSPQLTSLQLLVLVSGFPFLLTMIFLRMSLQLEKLVRKSVRKTLPVDGSAVVQRNLAKPHMVWDETKIDEN